MPSRYTVQIERRALKALQKIPLQVRSRLQQAIDQLALNPRPSGAKALAGRHNLCRLRVGDYRIVYQVRDKALIVLVIKIGHRRDVYRGL